MRIIALVVAYNRQDLLTHTLDALAAQTRPPDAVLVIDNASSDASGAVAANHPVAATVITLTRNTGGAGGFAAGLAHATLSMQAEAIWLMDDDTVPTPRALQALEQAWQAYPGRLALACSKVVWTDGRDHPMNTPRTRLWPGRKRWQRAKAIGARPIRTGSFVSMLVAARCVEQFGLPKADYFIWNDDFEYSARLSRRGEAVFVPDSVSEHHTARPAGAADSPGDRFYFDVRNKIWTLWWGGVFGPVEGAAYLAYSLWGWRRVLVKAEDRPKAVKLLVKGLADGLKRPPRPTARVLGALGEISQQVARLG